MSEKIDRTDTSQLTDKPAAKILEFLRDMEKEMGEGKRATFSTEHGVLFSKMMESLEPVGRE